MMSHSKTVATGQIGAHQIKTQTEQKTAIITRYTQFPFIPSNSTPIEWLNMLRKKIVSPLILRYRKVVEERFHPRKDSITLHQSSINSYKVISVLKQLPSVTSTCIY